METRVYYAEVVEELINELKTDYTSLMRKRMKENDDLGAEKASSAIVALGIIQDRILDLETKTIEL